MILHRIECNFNLSAKIIGPAHYRIGRKRMLRRACTYAQEIDLVIEI